MERVEEDHSEGGGSLDSSEGTEVGSNQGNDRRESLERGQDPSGVESGIHVYTSARLDRRSVIQVVHPFTLVCLALSGIRCVGVTYRSVCGVDCRSIPSIRRGPPVPSVSTVSVCRDRPSETLS